MHVLDTHEGVAVGVVFASEMSVTFESHSGVKGSHCMQSALSVGVSVALLSDREKLGQEHLFACPVPYQSPHQASKVHSLWSLEQGE